MNIQRVVLNVFFVGLSFVCVHNLHAASGGRSVADLGPDELNVIRKAGQLKTVDVSFRELTSLAGIMKLVEDHGALAINAINNRLGEGQEVLPVENCALIRALYLTCNALNTGHLKLFSGLKQITDLMLANNKITDDVLPILKSLKTLQHLCLSDNELTTIDMRGDDFELPHLKKLDVTANKISSVYLGSASTSNLQEFLLANNQLTRIERGMFCGVNLTSLNLSFNNIEFICDGALADLPVLSHLYLLGNRMIQKPTPAALAGPNNVKIHADYDSPFAHLDVQEFKNVCPREIYGLPQSSSSAAAGDTVEASRSCAIA